MALDVVERRDDDLPPIIQPLEHKVVGARAGEREGLVHRRLAGPGLRYRAGNAKLSRQSELEILDRAESEDVRHAVGRLIGD